MSSNDSTSDLDSRIAAIVESTVGRMRDEMMHRMEDTESRLRDITGHLHEPAAAAPVDEAAVEPPAASPAAAASDATNDLFEAVVAMDRGTSQQEVLAALLEGIGRFAGRSALFLTRSDVAQGWGSYGFDEMTGDMQQVVLSYGEGPLATLSEGRGCVALSASECAELCQRMGASPGAEGLLVPFVLRDRLAAALYIDRFADDPPLGRHALQLLAYVGAQTVEGLALRQRTETPTLQVATEDVEAPGVALWEAAPSEEAAPVSAPEPPAAGPEVAAPPIAAPPIAAPPPAEPEVAEPAAVEPSFTEPVVSEPQLSEPHVTPPQLTEPEAPAAAPPTELTVDEPADESTPPQPATEEMPAIETESESVADDEWELPAVPMDEPSAEPEAPIVAPVEEPTQPLETLVESPVEEPVDEPQPWTATAGADFSTAESAPTPGPAEMMPPPETPPSAPAGESTEVRPPTDVSGPGWAFTASRAAAESGDDAQHEEARRLARLLVTEIKLYNEEQVEEGRRGNDIYPRLREDIDRSRQIFNERVDDAVREETDYFHEEMVRILAGGNAEALGV